MMKTSPLHRRTFLKGLGTAIALPLLESMTPLRAAASAVAGAKAPTRMAFMFVPNGVNMDEWTPHGEGANFTLPHILEPFSQLKRDILVVSGLTQDKGRANGDGPGDHARSAAVFLTGVQPLKSEGSQIRAGISCDQYVAEHIGQKRGLPRSSSASKKAGRPASAIPDTPAPTRTTSPGATRSRP